MRGGTLGRTMFGWGVEVGAGEMVPFLGCPSSSGVPSPGDCLWLHLLVSVLRNHGCSSEVRPPCPVPLPGFPVVKLQQPPPLNRESCVSLAAPSALTQALHVRWGLSQTKPVVEAFGETEAQVRAGGHLQPSWSPDTCLGQPDVHLHPEISHPHYASAPASHRHARPCQSHRVSPPP